jgi:hypothetical protein
VRGSLRRITREDFPRYTDRLADRQFGKIVEVSFELARHKDVLKEDKDVVHMVGELPDQADLLPGLGAGSELRIADQRLQALGSAWIRPVLQVGGLSRTHGPDRQRCRRKTPSRSLLS